MFSVLYNLYISLADVITGLYKAAMLAYKVYDAAVGEKKSLLRTHSREDFDILSSEESDEQATSQGNIQRGLDVIVHAFNRIYEAYKLSMDKLASPTACRIYSLVGAIFLIINPVSMPLGIAAFVVSTFSIVVAAGIEAKRLYNLRILQKEEKMLNEFKNVNDERRELINKLLALRPDVAKELIGAINLNAEIDPEYKSNVNKVKWQETIFKGVVGRVPENIACIMSSIASFNPVSISFAVLGTTINYADNIRMQRAFDGEVVKLLRDVEMLKKDAKLVYQNSKGLSIIKPAIDSRVADNVGLRAILQHLEKYPDASINQCVEECTVKTIEFERNNQFGLYRSFGDKTKEYLRCFGDVIMGGLSKETNYQMFAPRANNYKYYEQKLQEKKHNTTNIAKEHIVQHNIVQEKEKYVPVKDDDNNMSTTSKSYSYNAQRHQELISATVVNNQKQKLQVERAHEKVNMKFEKEHHNSYVELVAQNKDSARKYDGPAAGG